MKEWKSGLDLGIKSGKEKHISNIIVLDTEETTLFKNGDEFIAFNINDKETQFEELECFGLCYIWMISIDDIVYFGRKLEDVSLFMKELEEQAKGMKITIFVHNLSYDFQYLRNLFEMDVFAREQRKVISCQIKNTNIEFRCSMALSGLSLEKLGETFSTNTKKLTGSLDYNKIRNSKTTLTEEELSYCENDCLVVYEYISMMLSQYNNSFKKLPLTMTGIVRKALKEYISKNYKGEKYEKIAFKWWREYIAGMMNDVEIFEELVKAFAGGVSHANFFERCEVKKDVHHNDFDSSYIAAALSEKYPVSMFKRCKPDEKIDRERFCYLFTVKYTGATCQSGFNFVQYSKVFKNCEDFKLDNGRLAAGTFTITATDCDIDIIDSFYKYEKKEIISMRKAVKDYLPKCLVEFIVQLYLKKCELKKTKDENPVEYALAKQQLCSIYGMMITNTIREDVSFESQEWDSENKERKENRLKNRMSDDFEMNEKLKIQNELFKQTKEKSNFLSYAWGVWISAYSRKNLMDIIREIDFDGLYCDTDSLFYINNHDEFINQQNEKMSNKIQRMCEHHKIKFDGLEQLGHFQKEKDVKEFKTLGAKRYAVKNYDGTIEITVSGVNKEEGAKAFTSLEEFDEGFVFDREHSKKNVLVYRNNQEEITFTDYQGNTDTMNQRFGIAIIPTTYTIETSTNFKSSTAHQSVPYSDYLLNL